MTAFALVEGTLLTDADHTRLATSTSPVDELSVRYTADSIEVTCPKPEPSLQIATLGRTKAVVNGKRKVVSGEMFRSFE